MTSSIIDTQAGRAAYAPTTTQPPPQVREAAGLPWLFTGGSVTGDLPDINVWLALAVQEHPHHTAAKRYWDSVQAKPMTERNIWFCRVTMLGLVRLLCQPKVVGAGALNLTQALALYQQFRAIPGVTLLTEPISCDEELHKLINPPASPSTLPARLWTDAYLAAVAQSSGVRLVSFDQDFLRFGLDRCLVLQTI